MEKSNLIKPLEDENFNSQEKKNNGLSIDGLTASWFLFSFSRKNKKSETRETFKTLLPDGSLQVVNVEVSSHHKDKNGNTTLPGAFAQDVFLSMVDSLVNKIQNELPEFNNIKRRKGQFLPEVTTKIPSDYTSLSFRNKDIAENIGMTIKNARITDAIKHLKNTSIKITGTIFKDGNVQKLEHDSYYLTSVTAGKKLRGGMSVADYNRATFDEILIKQVLGGYIAKVDKDKLTSLKSGAPRKLYTLLATKKMSSFDGIQTVSVTESEIASSLQITRQSIKKYLKKYVEQLIDAKILTSYQISETSEDRVFIFEFTNEELVLQGVDDNQVNEYFDSLENLSKTDFRIKQAMESSQFNVTREDLEQLISDFKVYSKVKVKKSKTELRINKVVLWCDKLLWNIICGQKDMTVKGVLTHCLKKKTEPSIRSEKKYIPTLIKYKQYRNSRIVEKEFREKKINEKLIIEKIESESKLFYFGLKDEKKNLVDKLYAELKASLPIPVLPLDIYLNGLLNHSIEQNIDIEQIERLHDSYANTFPGNRKKPETIEITADS